jgi:carboxyl-terminal processing protease
VRTRPVLLLLCGALLGVAGTLTLQPGPAAATEGEDSPFANLAIFARALSHIEAAHVEAPNQDELVHGAIRGMVETLDPHSTYLDPEEFRMFRSDTQGRFGGVGVEVDVRDGWLTVRGVFEGGPADEAGVEVGDRFLAVGGRNARDMPLSEAVRIMRGEPGTAIEVRIRRDGEDDALVLSITREIIEVDAVEARILPDRILHIRLRAFQGTTTRELRRALDLAVERTAGDGGLRGVLLDLRRNPGGLLHEAVTVSDEFIGSGTLVTTRGRGGRLLRESTAHGPGTRPDWPMVVLVDHYTASAAEIVAGALQDHRRALVVGSTTWGKGSVQTLFQLPGGSALKLTIARYYTPSGRSIQAQGITPDIEVEQLAADDARELLRRAVDRFSEASLERHLEGDAERATEAEAEPLVGRGEVRRQVGAEDAPLFADDFQARMGHQVLDALIRRRAGAE